MPWTFAHPAAVLPLRRIGTLRLPLLGLVLGSMAPDFGYHIGRIDIARLGHSPLGLLVLCMPGATCLALLMIRCRRVLAAPLPQPHRAAVESLGVPPTDTARSLLLLMLAAWVGAFTHVVWDAFTHSFGLAVKVIPFLQMEVALLGGRTFHVYNLLQHLSTAAGVAVLSVAYRRSLGAGVSMIPDAAPERRKCALLAACALLSAIAGVAAGHVASPAAQGFSRFVVSSVIFATDAFAVMYFALAIHASRPGRAYGQDGASRI